MKSVLTLGFPYGIFRMCHVPCESLEHWIDVERMRIMHITIMLARVQ